MTDRSRSRRAASAVAAVLCAGLAAVLAWAVLDLPEAPGPLAEPVREGAPGAGASNPVTAVLLAFRAYDTWLEVAVVLAAAIGVLAVARIPDVAGRIAPPREPVLSWMTALIVPAIALAGGFLLWLGTSSPGGAFQAGAVLGAGLLLAWLAGARSVDALSPPALRPFLVAGTLGFVLIAAAPLTVGEPMLWLPSGAAEALIVAVEAGVTITVAVTLPVMVIAARAGGRESDALAAGGSVR